MYHQYGINFWKYIMKIKHSLVAATLLSAASFSSFAAPMYSIMELGFVHNGDRSSAYGISNSGLVVGNARARVPTNAYTGDDARTNTHAARFYVGEDYVADIGGMGYTGGHGGATARAVNDTGMAAGYGRGYSVTGERFEQAFVHRYQSGYMQNIGTLGGKEARAYGINNDGKVVGWSNTAMGSGVIEGFVYDSASNSMTGIGADILGGTKSFAFDINDAGTLVGNASTANGSGAAFMRSSAGAVTNIGSLAGTDYAEARAVNEANTVTGWSKIGLTDTAFVYDAATGMQAIGGLGGGSRGYDINSSGVVVGYADDGVSVDSRGRAIKQAVVEVNGQFVSIYELLSPAQQAMWKGLTEATSINDNGDIVGTGAFWTDKANGRSVSMAFKLSAVPVPGAVFLMGPALGLLGFMRKRRLVAAA